MLGRIIDVALKQRLLVFLGALALAVWGANAFLRLPIDAFPDVAPVQVLVAMRAPGLTPEELESRVTAPIEIAMRGIPNLATMRSTTRYSVALITFEFVDGTDIFWARAQVNERLQDMRDQLPAGADGGLAPIVTALGEMLMFTIDSDTLNAQQMRQLVDWTIRPALRGLPGVADINVLGGFVRTFEVAAVRRRHGGARHHAPAARKRRHLQQPQRRRRPRARRRGGAAGALGGTYPQPRRPAQYRGRHPWRHRR